VLDGESTECAERGFLLLPVAFRHQMSGRLDEAHGVAVEATGIGDRVGDADLSAFGRNIQGWVLVRMGQIERGMALLDESMLMATANKLSPVFTGLIYCAAVHQDIPNKRVRNCGMVDITEESKPRLLALSPRSAILPR
jgi:hypothetical protein